VSMGHSARNTAGIRVRQPLSEAAFGVPSNRDAELVRRLQDLIAEELNVKSVTILEATEGLVYYKLKPVDTLGRDLRGDFPAVRNAIINGDEAQITEWGKKLLAGENISVQINGKVFDLTPEQVIVQQTGAEGYAVAENAGYLAALKTDLSEALIQEGLAREVVRRIQTLRKDADLDITDRIIVSYNASDRLAKAIEVHRDYIAGETLADNLNAGDPGAQAHQSSDEFDGESLTVGITKQS
ncbi:MAG TPA: DUF5915 domain-containing protein, partial [Aggregatilineales bacterium]|nr:DUF5915 domain-containing protein [Aggregatilineales bacterium]